MKSQRRWFQFLIFTAIGFGPLVLVGCVLLPGVLLNISLMFGESTPTEIADFVFWAIAILALFIAVTGAAFWLFQKTSRWLVGGVVLYGSWLLLAFLLAYFIAGAMAGISMAVVDGAVQGPELRSATMQQAFSLLLCGQVVILPWALFASWIIRRRFFPGQNLSGKPV